MSPSRFSDTGRRFRRAEDVTDYGSSQRLGFGRQRLACLSDQTDSPDMPLQSAELFALHHYWLSRRNGRRFPSRADIDPLDIPYVLGNVMLVDVRREPQSFGVRLHGSSMVERLGHDLTGQTLGLASVTGFRVDVLRCCERVVRDERPLIEIGHDSRYGRKWAYEALWLPLAAGDRVDMLLRAEICRTEPHLNPTPGPIRPEFVGQEADHEFDAAIPTV